MNAPNIDNPILSLPPLHDPNEEIDLRLRWRLYRWWLRRVNWLVVPIPHGWLALKTGPGVERWKRTP